MCGICGIVNLDRHNQVDKNLVVAMKDVMTHRGPDDDGLHLDGNVGLGFRRLSIVDLNTGNQPIGNESGDIWTIFNGEIYNHAEIRKELISKGHVYRTHSDTETIVHLYEEEGLNSFRHLNGMFGIAIWDAPRQRLVLARDRLGIKPLYYTRTSEGLLFASEIKSLLKSRTVKLGINLEGLQEYLIYRFLAGERTMFQGVYNLLPGHFLVLTGGEIQITRFWDLPEPGAYSHIDEAGAVDQLNELLRDAVEKRLMSDVPLGAFCSGGVDSSLTSAYAAKASSVRFNTFSVGFNEADYDESRYAEMVSKRLGTHHHQLTVDNKTFADSLPKLIWHNDEPLNHPNSVQIYHISKLAKQYVTVVLTGEGADELFSGYPRYLIAKWCGMLLRVPSSARHILGRMVGMSPSRKIRKLARFLPLSGPELVALNSYFTDWESLGSVLAAESDFHSVIESRLSLLGDTDWSTDCVLDSLTRIDLKAYLVSILNRQDKMSMAASLESRVPFLDHRLVEWAFRIPASLKLRGFQTKVIVKKLGERVLPGEVVYRRKSGFGVPLSEWLRDRNGMGRYLELFSEPRFQQRGYLKTEQVQRMAHEHLSGAADHSEILWELINLELWQRVLLEGDTY